MSSRAARDVGLDRMRRISRLMVAGSLVGGGVLSALAARALPGKHAHSASPAVSAPGSSITTPPAPTTAPAATDPTTTTVPASSDQTAPAPQTAPTTRPAPTTQPVITAPAQVPQPVTAPPVVNSGGS